MPWTARFGSLLATPLPGIVLAFGMLATLLANAAVAGSGTDSGNAVARALKLPEASLLVEERGRIVISHNPDRAMVPASTMKILNALAAIERWGLDHRFHTDFHLANDDRLWVVGFGDPYLVSEELALIAEALKARGVRNITGIGLDDGYFAPNIRIDGRSGSSNPYDAPVTALAANFNTVNVVNDGRKIASAEAQTPLTPLARQLARGMGNGTHRLNLGTRDKAVRYFGELLGVRLQQAGIRVDGTLHLGRLPVGAKQVYRHHNSRDLRTVIASMLQYSNNFIANDLFLGLADRTDSRSPTRTPLNMLQAQRAFAAWVDRTFAWRGYRIEDGAGLSRGNRLSARQLLEAVKAFAPYRGLLPERKGRVRAKTGTLRGVSCYAGFVKRGGRWEPFSLLIGQPVADEFRYAVADTLASAPDLSRLCPGGSC